MTKRHILLEKWRWFLLFALLFAFVLIARYLWMTYLSAETAIINAAIGGSIAAIATIIGTLPILFSARLNQKMLDGMIGFGAGVMLAASFFSLTLPGIRIAQEQGYGNWEAPMIVGGGILIGAILLWLMERYLPHEHFIMGKTHEHAVALKRTWLFVFAISLHNLPEGLAIGVAFGGLTPEAASTVAAGIAIQDIPEGLVVAMALLQAGYRKRTCIAIGAASGFVEPIGAIIGAAISGLSTSILPWAMGFSAGAMLFVISHEVIPESHRKGHESIATSGLMIGFVLMMVLDTALG